MRRERLRRKAGRDRTLRDLLLIQTDSPAISLDG